MSNTHARVHTHKMASISAGNGGQAGSEGDSEATPRVGRSHARRNVSLKTSQNVSNLRLGVKRDGQLISVSSPRGAILPP